MLLTAFMITLVTVSGHTSPSDHDEDVLGWLKDVEHIHEAEGDSCNAHTRSHLLMGISEEYKLKQERENEHADKFVEAMKLRKRFAHKSGSEFEEAKLKLSPRERRLLFSEYDDEIDSLPVVQIPVAFHILFDQNNTGLNLSVAQLESQIRVLNEDFRANNSIIRDGDANELWDNRTGDAKIEFYLAGVDRREVDNVTEICSDDFVLKNSSRGGLDGWNASSYMNVWTCYFETGLLGYAYFPCLLDTIYEYIDGIVMFAGVVGAEDDDINDDFYFGPSELWWLIYYRQGRVMSHEVGHWLNLRHIWGDWLSCNQSIATDYVSDTPPALYPNGGCPNGTNSCDAIDPELGRDLPDMIENIMDYTVDECHYMFTEEQVWRMRAALSGDGCRSKLYYTGAQLEGNQTLQPSSEGTPASVWFSCDDGCPLFEELINDDYCGCSNCEDEPLWTCDTCAGGCPTECDPTAFGTLCTSNGSASATTSTPSTSNDSDGETDDALRMITLPLNVCVAWITFVYVCLFGFL